MIKSFLLLLSLFSLNLSAEWRQENVVFEMEGVGPDQIRLIIKNLNTADSNLLLKENLTSVKPVKLLKSSLTQSSYKWYNDEKCTLSDPNEVQQISAQKFVIRYIYFKESGPEELILTSVPLFFSPCQSKNPQNFVRSRIYSKL